MQAPQNCSTEGPPSHRGLGLPLHLKARGWSLELKFSSFKILSFVFQFCLLERHTQWTCLSHASDAGYKCHHSLLAFPVLSVLLAHRSPGLPAQSHPCQVPPPARSLPLPSPSSCQIPPPAKSLLLPSPSPCQVPPHARSLVRAAPGAQMGCAPASAQNNGTIVTLAKDTVLSLIRLKIAVALFGSHDPFFPTSKHTVI